MVMARDLFVGKWINRICRSEGTTTMAKTILWKNGSAAQWITIFFSGSCSICHIDHLSYDSILNEEWVAIFHD